VKGHAGHPENERADRLAVRGVAEASGAAQAGS
jgi:ribonuclease HI